MFTSVLLMLQAEKARKETPRGTECSVNGESLIATRYGVAGRASGKLVASVSGGGKPQTLTNLVIVFHNNRERAQRATKRFFLSLRVSSSTLFLGS